MSKPVDFNEDFNEISPDRRDLLVKLQKGMDLKDDISPSFWAACQICDLNMLKAMVAQPKTAIQIERKMAENLKYCNMSLSKSHSPLLTMPLGTQRQKSHTDSTLSSPVLSRSSASTTPSILPLSGSGTRPLTRNAAQRSLVSEDGVFAIIANMWPGQK